MRRSVRLPEREEPTIAELEGGVRFMAWVVVNHGDRYAPIFESLETHMENAKPGASESIYGADRPATIRERARMILRMGLGEPIGNPDARADMVRGFEAGQPPGHWRRERIIENLSKPIGEPVVARPVAEAPFLSPRRARTSTIIYVVGFDRYVKIGITERDVQFRIAGLQTGCPEKLEIYATFSGDLMLEKELHARFAALRRNGEWFLREGALAEWIEKGCPVDAP